MEATFQCREAGRDFAAIGGACLLLEAQLLMTQPGLVAAQVGKLAEAEL